MTLPVATVAYFAVWLFQKILTWKLLQLLFTPFSTFSYLLVYLFADNIQYLCFRASQQLRFTVPRSPTEWVSIIFGFTTMLAVALTSCSLYLMVRSLNRTIKSRIIAKKTMNLIFLFSVSLLGRALTGFLHAYIDDEQQRILLLFVVSLLVFLTSLSYILTFGLLKSRSSVFQLLLLMTKTALNLLLVIEVRTGLNYDSLTQQERVFSMASAIMCYTLMVAFLLEYLFTVCWNFLREIIIIVKASCVKVRKPKKIIKQRNRRAINALNLEQEVT